jgi:hypothetical protein
VSYYATLFAWSRDPDARGDAEAFIDAISAGPEYVFDPDTLPRRVLAGPGEPTIIEASIGAFAHPVVEAFDPEPFLTALVGAIDPLQIRPYGPCDIRVDRDDQGRAAWIGVIIPNAHRELLYAVGKVAAAVGLTGYDHDTGATLAHCAPKRWLLTGDEERVWDPTWDDIERSFAAAPKGEHFKTLEHPSMALVQYLGTPDRLTVEYVRAWGGPTVSAGPLTLSDARAIFAHFYAHTTPHPNYHWRSGD